MTSSVWRKHLTKCGINCISKARLEPHFEHFGIELSGGIVAEQLEKIRGSPFQSYLKLFQNNRLFIKIKQHNEQKGVSQQDYTETIEKILLF